MIGSALATSARHRLRLRHAGAFIALLAIALLAAGCGRTAPTLVPATVGGAPASNPSIVVTPANATIDLGGVTQSFTATFANGSSAGVLWQVNGVPGGDATVCTISASGAYTSPAVMPVPSTVTIIAVSSSDGSQNGTATVTLSPAIPVTVQVSPASASVVAGTGSQVFVAVLGGSSNQAVTWQVNGVTGGDATLGTISASGVYTAPATPPAQPSVTITAISVADPTRSGTATVHVTPAVPPVSVSVAPSAATLTSGSGTQAFTATVLNAQNGAVTWQVNGIAGGNATVGTIAATGLYTSPAMPPSPATVTVTATSVADSSRSASAAVTIRPAGSVAVTPAGANVQAGIGTQAFSATVSNEANSNVTWQVNGIAGGNATVGTISAAGLYTAPANVPAGGTATVTAVVTADPSKSASATVTVTAPVTVAVSPTTAMAQAGIGSQTFVATVSNTANKSLTWQVNGVAGGNATVGTVTASGLYTAPASVPSPAAVTIMAVSAADPSRSASATLTVSSPVAVTVSPASATVQAGIGTQTLTVAVSNASNTAVTWQVNGVTGGNASIGTVSASGVYTAPTNVPSPATVTVKAVSVADPSRSGSSSLTIAPPITVSVSPSSSSVQAGIGSQTFVATVGNGGNTGVTWQVNGVAGGSATAGTISSTGVYRAPATVPSPAAVTITAVSVADPTRSGVATVTVTAPVSVSVSPSLASVAAGTGTQQFAATVANGTSGAVTWQVNGVSGGNMTVGTVSAAGIYAAPSKPPSPATVSVTAISTDDPSKSASASVTVTTASTPPTISGTPPTTATIGKAYTFQPTASGGSGGTLTFTVANLPSWATFSTATGLLSGTPAAGAAGTYANISISVSDGSNTATLPAFTITVSPASTGSATLNWSIPTSRTDGTALSNLAGFHIYYGTTPDSYPTAITVANPSVSTYVVSNIPSGTYYFVATAYDASGVESAYTNAVSITIP
jgi:hypothetical protein